jgi:hypothetical protein
MHVRIEIPEVGVNHDLNLAELGDLSFHSPQEQVVGLMSSDLEIRTQAEYVTAPVGDRFCFWVDGISVVLRYQALDVYVAREYAPGSCPYNAILDHEQEHVAVARGQLDVYGPRFRSALASLLIPKPRSPILVDSPEDAKKKTQGLFEKLLAPISEELKTVMAEAQADLDTPQEYWRVRRRCPNW